MFCLRPRALYIVLLDIDCMSIQTYLKIEVVASSGTYKLVSPTKEKRKKSNLLNQNNTVVILINNNYNTVVILTNLNYNTVVILTNIKYKWLFSPTSTATTASHPEAAQERGFYLPG